MSLFGGNQQGSTGALFGGATPGGLFGGGGGGGGLFGAQPQTQAPGGLFNTGSGMGGGTGMAMGGGGGLFGQQGAMQQPTGSLFGGQQPSGGLFGAGSVQPSAPNGGLFGGQQTQTGGLFGGGASGGMGGGLGGGMGGGMSGALFGGQQKPMQSGLSFGASQSTMSGSGGLFGSATFPAAGGLVGSTGQATGGLFGATSGYSLLGGGMQQQSSMFQSQAQSSFSPFGNAGFSSNTDVSPGTQQEEFKEEVKDKLKVKSYNYSAKYNSFSIKMLRLKDYQNFKNNIVNPAVAQGVQQYLQVAKGAVPEPRGPVYVQQSAGPVFGSQAQGGGIFGGGGQQPAAGGLFGGGAQTGGLFGGAGGATQAPGGLFGGAQQTGGLFGGAQPQQQQQGGVFGGAQQAGGLFGGGAQQSTTGGLFGGAQTQQQGSGGLFGGGGSQPTTGGLFGGQPQQASGGLFGGQPQQAGGLFSSTQGGQQQGGLFGGAQSSTPSPYGQMPNQGMSPMMYQNPMMYQPMPMPSQDSEVYYVPISKAKVKAGLDLSSLLSNDPYLGTESTKQPPTGEPSYQEASRMVASQYRQDDGRFQPSMNALSNWDAYHILEQSFRKQMPTVSGDSRYTPRSRRTGGASYLSDSRLSYSNVSQPGLNSFLNSTFLADSSSRHSKNTAPAGLSVFVSFEGRTESVAIDQAHNIAELLSRTLHRFSVPPGSRTSSLYQLTFRDKSLDLVKTVRECQIKDKDTVFLKQAEDRPSENQLASPATIPFLSKPGYSTVPSYDVLCNMTERELRGVENFTIKNEFAELCFTGSTDLRGIDLDKCIKLQKGMVEIYPEGTTKPGKSFGLNKDALVTLFQVGLKGKKDVQAFIDKFKNKLETKGANFIGFDLAQDSVKFMIHPTD